MIKKGSILICIRSDDHSLTENKEYVCINGLEEGIFPDRPYVSVVDNRNIVIKCHASRFKLK